MKITLIGCGQMGSALLKGWLRSDIGDEYVVVEPSGLPESFQDNDKITYTPQSGEEITHSDVVILAVKPQKIGGILKDLRFIIGEKTVVISIVAGKTITALQDILSVSQPIIRAMPNTPAALGKGAIPMIVSTSCTDDLKDKAEKLMETAGTISWIEDETLFDAITAVSGSGPAYVFYMTEVLADAGKRAGLSPALANQLAREVVIGAAALMEHEDKSASDLRKAVTSPGGTTAAALDLLMNGDMQHLFDEAIIAAKNRSRELKGS